MKTKPTLREYLYQERITTDEFASMCGVSRPTISSVLNGKHESSIVLVIKIWEKTGYKVRLASIFPSLVPLYDSLKRIRKNDLDEEQ